MYIRIFKFTFSCHFSNFEKLEHSVLVIVFGLNWFCFLRIVYSIEVTVRIKLCSFVHYLSTVLINIATKDGKMANEASSFI